MDMNRQEWKEKAAEMSGSPKRCSNGAPDSYDYRYG